MKLGIETLLLNNRSWLTGRNVGLVSHSAAVTSDGTTSAALLAGCEDLELTALFGPEHGFEGKAGAGVACRDRKDQKLKVPVYSLYGKTRKPYGRMLSNVDLLIVDFQDLAVRCYTYVSTMRLVLEAAAECGKPVIVADRPVPLPNTIDGPILRPDCESFVSMIPSTLCYGMTPGETALWLKDQLRLPLDLTIAKMEGWPREVLTDKDYPLAVSPSPAIKSWHIAHCYPATVFSEAVPSLDHGRKSATPFETLSANWINPPELCERLRAARLRGIGFSPCENNGCPGIRLNVRKPSTFRPVLASVAILKCLQDLYGKNQLWAGVRGRFFDQLYGTEAVREALLDDVSAQAIAEMWKEETRTFRRNRSKHLLYKS